MKKLFTFWYFQGLSMFMTPKIIYVFSRVVYFEVGKCMGSLECIQNCKFLHILVYPESRWWLCWNVQLSAGAVGVDSLINDEFHFNFSIWCSSIGFRIRIDLLEREWSGICFRFTSPRGEIYSEWWWQWWCEAASLHSSLNSYPLSSKKIYKIKLKSPMAST